ncbi:hypothetical protein [Serratia fonticola]|uniref:hypothetical protein n=1 Tax=Serratia fonticola TaxID=47917 RepID=UPI0021BAAC0E|nr:hypothetical protein [Serratia fonticola]
MAIEDEILAHQLKRDIFYHEDSKVSGIARLAVDNGFDTLTPRQKAVVNPFLTQPCEGVTDPGDHHNGCTVQLAGAELLEAYEEYGAYDSLHCERCRDEKNDIEAHRERFMRD